MGIKYLDMFSGIGGFRSALDRVGGFECVGFCEIDEKAKETYEAIYDTKGELYFNDAREINPNALPDIDLICGGFPCQPFSQAGQKKGFDDTRGTLFFNIANIIREKKPKAIFLENVRGLLNHDSGKTFEVIKNTIDELGYSLHFKVIKASEFNLPQHRPRLYMVGFRKDINDNFEFPQQIPLQMTMSDVFDGAKVNKDIGFTLRVGGKGSPIDDRRNWDGYLVNGEIMRIKPKQAMRMQGFPESFIFPVSETVAMKQLGNSVAVTVIQAIAKQIIKVLDEN